MSTQFSKVYACYVWKQWEIWLQNCKMDTKNNAMHLNPKHKWCMKIILVKYLKTKNFSVLIDRASVESGRKSWLKIKGFSIGQKTHSIDRNSGNLNFWKKCRRLCKKQLNPSNFMNEMHENEFKCFSKTWVFNPELQNKVFNHQKHNFCQPLNIFCIKHHRKHNLGWPNQIHTQFHVLSLAKNNLWSVCN